VDRPNIVWIVLDTFRYDRLWRTVRGAALCPHLGAFAEQGVSFENAISPGPHTCPSHAAFFTGDLPINQGIYDHRQVVGRRSGAGSLMANLREAGYATLAFSQNPVVESSGTFGREFDVAIYTGEMGNRAGRRGGLLRSLARRGRDAVLGDGRERAQHRQVEKLIRGVPTALRALRSHWPERPVFLFCNLMTTHDPYLFKPEDAAFARPRDARLRKVKPRTFFPLYMLDLLGVRPMSDEQLAQVRWCYDASAHYVDRLVARLMQGIDSCLDPEQTDVVIVGDHGELLGDYGFFMHNTVLYDELVHVPMMVRSPVFPRGARCDRLVQSHWMWALARQRAGLEDRGILPVGQGSLLDAVRGSLPEKPAYSFVDPNSDVVRLRQALAVAVACGVNADRVKLKPMDTHLQAVRLGDKALILTKSGAVKILQRSDDGPGRELSGPECERAKAELASHLLRMDGRRSAPPTDVPPPGRDLLKQLRDLGYA